jgi:hypothetical protein
VPEQDHKLLSLRISRLLNVVSMDSSVLVPVLIPKVQVLALVDTSAPHSLMHSLALVVITVLVLATEVLSSVTLEHTTPLRCEVTVLFALQVMSVPVGALFFLRFVLLDLYVLL